MKKLVVLWIALMMMLMSLEMATAESIMIYGSVICTQPYPVVCTAEGTIEQVYYSAGERVATGDVLATVATQKVYAASDGTVYLFGEAGDQIADITAKYGAVAFLAPSMPYTITATAADRNGTAIRVIPGEIVYLRCYKDGRHMGKGILAKIQKGEYTVIVTEGEFDNNETVSIYRDEKFTDVSRIGRAKVNIAEMDTYGGTGCLVKFHVQNGTKVKKGTLLYETISGSFMPEETHHSQIISPVSGIISAVYKHRGDMLTNVSKAPAGDGIDASEAKTELANVVAEIYPDDCLRIVALAPENVLNSIHVDDEVYVTCQFIENMAAPVIGKVETISRIPIQDDTGMEAQYEVYIVVEDASVFYYGMNVVVTTQNNN